MPVEVGESVIFGKFDGESITYNGETHTVIRDDDILVKFAKDSGVTLKSAEATFDNVLIKVEKVEVADTASGILISATVKKASVSSVGEVLKVGPGRHAFNGEVMGMDVVPGDMVKFRDFAAQEINLNGEDYAIVKMSDLLAKF
jgi:chaperonin GroES